MLQDAKTPALIYFLLDSCCQKLQAKMKEKKLIRSRLKANQHLSVCNWLLSYNAHKNGLPRELKIAGMHTECV